MARPKRTSTSENPALQAIWHAVCARQAGFALKVAPEALHLPWHRVVGAGGRIVFPRSSPEHKEQARRLRAEGVMVQNGRVARFAATRVGEP
jgi:alkylated DNA nucleotide flippase Atl1